MKTCRFWELDFSKGIAIVLVVLYHLVFDLDTFTSINIDSLSRFWLLFARLSASLFIFIAGISLSISYSKAQVISKLYARKRIFYRGIQLLFLANIITIITLLLFPDDPILFGILHLLGTCTILGYFFCPFKYFNLLLAIVILGLGPIISSIKVSYGYLLWLGIEPYEFYTLDYFPLISWFGLYVLGIFCGNVFYTNAKRTFFIPDYPNRQLVKIMSRLGSKTLLIYLVHQPLLLGSIYVLYAGKYFFMR